jgi:hypothetical protein
MDAIRKKMQSLKAETSQLFATINRYEREAIEATTRSEKAELNMRDVGKKSSHYESDFDETNDKLCKTILYLEEKEKSFITAEEEVCALARRVLLMEDENKKADTALADTITKLALTSKEADGILKKVKYFESKTMRNEMEIEEMDKMLRETNKMNYLAS